MRTNVLECKIHGDRHCKNYFVLLLYFQLLLLEIYIVMEISPLNKNLFETRLGVVTHAL
jgi:hypothetical protein